MSELIGIFAVAMIVLSIFIAYLIYADMKLRSLEKKIKSISKKE